MDTFLKHKLNSWNVIIITNLLLAILFYYLENQSLTNCENNNYLLYKMNKNLDWIDVAKGLGIISVVAGHIYSIEICKFIYLYHMPLFFFISGFLFKPYNNQKSFFIKKAKSLLIPYFVFLITEIVLFTDFYHNGSLQILDILTKIIFGGKKLNGIIGVFWFVTCLFLTQQIMNILIVKLGIKITSILMFFFLILSYINSYFFKEISLPWNANVVLAASPIFFAGYLNKIYPLKIKNLYLFISGIAILTFSYLYQYNSYDMKITVYGYPFVTIISSLTIILIIKDLSKKISRIHLLKIIFSDLGKSSLIIMFTHKPFIYVFREYLTTNQSYILFLSLIFSYFIYLILTKTKLTKALFLGEIKMIDLYYQKLKE